MSKSFYITSVYSRKEYLQDIVSKLEKIGYKNKSLWINSTERLRTDELIKKWKQISLEGIKESDIFILDAEYLSISQSSLIELGIAIGLGKSQIYCVGFNTGPNWYDTFTNFEDWSEVIAYLISTKDSESVS